MLHLNTVEAICQLYWGGAGRMAMVGFSAAVINEVSQSLLRTETYATSAEG